MTGWLTASEIVEIVFLQGAQAEMQAAYEQTGGSSSRRGEPFLQRLEHTLALLRTNPGMAGVYGGRFRRLLVRGFSFGLFYTVAGERIFVAAVLDLRQDPERIRQRLGLSP